MDHGLPCPSIHVTKSREVRGPGSQWQAAGAGLTPEEVPLTWAKVGNFLDRATLKRLVGRLHASFHHVFYLSKKAEREILLPDRAQGELPT